MAELSFDYLIGPPFREVADFGDPPELDSYLENLEPIQFDLNFLPQLALQMPMKVIVELSYLYYDEMQNVWYQRFDGIVKVGPVAKVATEKDYPISIFFPLDIHASQ